MIRRSEYLTLMWIVCLMTFTFPVELKSQTLYRVTAQRLNIRSSPSSRSTVVGSLSVNDTISVSEIVKDWASFQFKGKRRYVSTRYLEKILIPEVVEVEEVVETVIDEPIDTAKPTPIIESNTPIETQSHKNLFKKIVGNNSGDLHLIADLWGGYSNFSWNNGSPKMNFGFGVDVGVQCNYQLFWSKIPKGLLGEITIGYARRGSGAFPINYFSIRTLPVAYRWTIRSNLSLIGKAGLYIGIPFSKIKSYTTCVDYGLSVGAGIEYGKWGLIASYEHGFAKTIESHYVDLYNRGAFLTLSYKFFKLK